jgi:glycosyltransferase involved in cell wall biosynthesis
VLEKIDFMIQQQNRLRLFTWHIHGSYLYYLSQANVLIYIPINNEKSEGYVGRGSTFPFGENVIEIPSATVAECQFDCILFQTANNFLVDQYEILSEDQRRLPRLFLEHDPPQESPTNTHHVVNDPEVPIVHVTNFNALMWDNGQSPVYVVDHGIHVKPVNYDGNLDRGIVVINNLHERGRRLGLDVFLEVRKHVPLDIIGMNTEKIGGLGEILHPHIPEFIKNYRFFFNPIRYTSLGLAVLEAMMSGIPVVGLATTELVTVIRDGESGFVHTNVSYLIDRMKDLLNDRVLATRLGEAGRRVAMERFGIERFVREWELLLDDHVKHGSQSRTLNRTQHLNVTV